jgi:hypothetical protein
MAIRNEADDYDWALPRSARAGRYPKGLHDYDEPTPDFQDTMAELGMTLMGIVGVFFLIIVLVKVFTA